MGKILLLQRTGLPHFLSHSPKMHGVGMKPCYYYNSDFQYTVTTCHAFDYSGSSSYASSPFQHKRQESRATCMSSVLHVPKKGKFAYSESIQYNTSHNGAWPRQSLNKPTLSHSTTQSLAVFIFVLGYFPEFQKTCLS